MAVTLPTTQRLGSIICNLAVACPLSAMAVALVELTLTLPELCSLTPVKNLGLAPELGGVKPKVREPFPGLSVFRAGAWTGPEDPSE